MSRRQRSRLRYALLALCLLLTAQWTLAAHACPVIKAAGEEIAWQSALTDEGAAPCHQQLPSDGVCVKHCVGDDQANGSSAVVPAMPPPGWVLRLPAVEQQGTVLALAATTHADATAPPLSILYCVLLA